MVLAAAPQPLVCGKQIQRRKQCVILSVYILGGKRKSCPMLFIYICHWFFLAFYILYSLNLLRKGGQRICLMVAVSISVGVAAVAVMNSCASVKRKPTPLGAKFGTVIISRSMRLSCGLSENMVIVSLLAVK